MSTGTLHLAASPIPEPPQPIAALRCIAASIDLDARAAEALGAQWDADFHIESDYPETLVAVLERSDWVGYPELPAQGIRRCAAAPLGGGWWLHHTTRRPHPDVDEGDEPLPVLTLVAPCECGAYATRALIDEDDLIALLRELPESIPGTPVPCEPQLHIQRDDLFDARHANVEDAPF